MAGIAWNRFRGIAPKIEPRLLPAPLGQKATNCRVFSGSLEPWRKTLEVATPSKAVNGTVRSIFRMDDLAGGASKWLNWLTDVHVVRGFVAGSDQRIYWTGDGEPRVSNYALATAGADMPTNYYVLGVPAPLDAPTVASVTGGTTSGTRRYRYTLQTAWGEEGAPSAEVGATNNTIGATWNLTLPTVSLNNSGNCTNIASSGGITTFTLASVQYLRPGEQIVFAGIGGAGAALNAIAWTIATVAGSTVAVNTGSTYNPGAVSGVTYSRKAPHNIGGMTKNLYRTDAAGVWRRVASNIALATTTFADTMENSTLALQIAETSTFFAMPPADLVSLAEMPGSFMVGVSPSQGLLCMSQPGFPHAWPLNLQQVIPFKPVGLGVYEQTVVIGTQGPPYMARGSSPSLLVPERIDEQWPCLSLRGIVSMSDGVMYPTTNGYALIGAGGARIVTQDVIAADGFAVYAPATMRAARFQNRLFMWHDGVLAEKGLIIDASEGVIDLVPLTTVASAAWTDPATGNLYLVSDGKVQQWDASVTRLTAEWRSSVKPMPKPASPSMARVEASYGDLSNAAEIAAQLAALQALNTALLAGTESYPGQSILQGVIGDAAIGDEGPIGGSLLFENLGLDDIPSIQFLVWSDGTLIASLTPTDNEPFILPVSDEPGRRFEVGVITTIPVQAIEIAESAEDLMQMAP